MKYLIYSVLIVVAIFVAAYYMVICANTNEIVECRQWKEQAAEYPNFFLTGWQDAQCRAHHIVIDADVKI